MGLITREFTYSAGAVIVASQHNTNENALYNLVNGNLSTANLASNAAIVDTQLATISTTGKVNVSALTVGSQATGDLLYASSATAWARLGKGTALQVLRMNSGATLPEWGDGTEAATQAEMEAASSTTTYVSPGRAHYHPGAAKAWLKFDGTASSPITFDAGYGISGTTIVKNATGTYTITWGTAFSSANYVVIGNGKRDGDTNLLNMVVSSLSTTSCQVVFRNQGDATADPKIACIVAFGDV